MQHFSLAACIAVLSGIFSAALVAADLRRRPQPMRIMNAVWILTPLWASVIGLAAYFTFGRAGKPHDGLSATDPDGTQTEKRRTGMEMKSGNGTSMSPEERNCAGGRHTGMAATKDRIGRAISDIAPRMRSMSEKEMHGMPEPHAMRGMETYGREADHKEPEEMKTAGGKAGGMTPHTMEMGAPRPRWQSVVLSTLHCGAGCTLADLVGEWFLYFVPVIIGGSMLAGTWVTDYLLALLFGIGFQYAAIRGMERIPRGEAVIRAAKADFLSLTAWQAGMYGWMAVAMFLFGDGTMAARTTFWFWFMMQAAMCCGFLVSLPVNVLLIRKGIKKGM